MTVAGALELTVAVLTRDEERNLPSLLDRLIPSLAATGLRFEIVVIDGDSTDSTWEIARSRGCRVVVQNAPGHGAALREAFAQAQAPYLLLMDADHSHPPEVIPALLAQRDGADLVLASRYVKGGSSSDRPVRRALSRLLNALYRLALRLPYHDLSSGFRLYRTEALSPLRLEARDIDLQEEIVFRMHHGGSRILEIPFAFAPRRHGSSHVRTVALAGYLARTLVKLWRESLAMDARR